MCRLMAFMGQNPILLADVVLWPDRSIIKQSYDARERLKDPTLPFHLGHGNLNGDGFGIGWFSTEERRDVDPSPCVFTSITPAWNNENLARLACKIVSPLVFAHVRAAYPGMPVSEQNCHPFMWGRYLWMHNGVVGGFAAIKRTLLATLSDAAYNAIQSFHSDSAVSFAVFLHHLPDMASPQPPDVLLQAMEATIATIASIQRAHGIVDPSLLNYCVSDGTTLVATRFVNPPCNDAASLYYAEGFEFVREEAARASQAAAGAAGAGGCSPCSLVATNRASSSSITHEARYELTYGARGARVAFVASEPITASSADWVAVPKNTALVITREKGGFINILRSPISTGPNPQPSAGPSLAVNGGGALATPSPVRPQGPPTAATPALTLSGTLAAATPASPAPAAPPLPAGAVAPSGRSSSPTLPGGPTSSEVVVCLEALSRGLSAKSRAWVARPLGRIPSTLSFTNMIIKGAGSPYIPELTHSNSTGARTPSVEQSLQAAVAHGVAVLGGTGGSLGCSPPESSAMAMRLSGGHAGPLLLSNSPSSGAAHTSMAAAASSWQASGGLGGTVTLSRATSRGEPDPFQRTSAAMMRDNSMALGAADEGGVGYSGVANGGTGSERDAHEFQRLVGHSGAVLCAVVDEVWQRLFTSSVDCTIKVWSLVDNRCLDTVVAGKKPVTQLQLVDGRWLYSIAGRRLRVWEANSLAPVGLLRIGNNCGNVRCCLVLGKKVYLGCQDASVKAFHVDPAAPEGSLTPFPPMSLTSPTGSGAHGGGEANDSVPAREPDYSTPVAGGHVGPVNALVAVRRGECVVSGASDAMIRVWAADDLTLLRTLRGHRGSVMCLLAVGNLLVSGARDNTLRVWDMDMDWMCRRTVAGHKDDVVALSAVTLSRHVRSVIGDEVPGEALPLPCTVVASASSDGTVRLWSLTWTCLTVLALPAAASPLAIPLPTTPPHPFNQPAPGTLAGRASGGGATADGLSRTHARGFVPAGVAAGQVAALPAALCCVLTRSAVVAGYGDAELRVWHCAEELHAAALQLAAAELGLTSPALAAMSGGGANGGAASSGPTMDADGQSPNAAMPGISIPTGPITLAFGCAPSPPPIFMHEVSATGTYGASGYLGAAALTEGSQPQRLAQANVEHVMTLLGVGAQNTGASRSSNNGGLGAALSAQDSPEQAQGQLPSTSSPTSTSGTPAPTTGRSATTGLLSRSLAQQQQQSSPGIASSCAPPSSPSAAVAAAASAFEAINGRPRKVGLSAFGSFTVVEPELLALGGRLAGHHDLRKLSAGSSRSGGGLVEAVVEEEREGDGPVSARGSFELALAGHQNHGSCERDSVASGSVASSLGALGVGAPGCVRLDSHLLAALAAGTGAWTSTGLAPFGAAGGGGGSPTGSTALKLDAEQLSMLRGALEGWMTRPKRMLAHPGASDLALEHALRDFVRIQTVSSNARLRDECLKGAKFLAKLLEGLGADVKVVRPFEDKNPVVIGRLGRDPTKPTICFYGHYDVQPANEAEWDTNPFELNAVNEYFYGRGTSDNKGPILAFIFAVRELLDECGCDGGACGPGGRTLPVNITFVFEGEEENGSIGFREAITQNLGWFEGVQLILISNTNWVGESWPCITYGMRGMISLSVTVSGPARDVHSGNDGGVFVEPMMDLLHVCASLMTPGSTHIKIPGFYEHVAPGLIDLAWSSLAQHGGEEFSMEGYRSALGVPALAPHTADTRALLEARWARPSLSVVDVRPSAGTTGMTASERSTCYRFGPTRFSVIPKTAVGKVSVRFVPRQDPAHIVSCLRAHIHSEFEGLGSPNSVHVHVDALGNWWEADVGSKWMQMAEAAVRREWGCEPLYTREGGTMPVASVLERLLGAPALMLPMGQSSDAPHLANERIRRTNLIKGKGVVRALLEEVAGLWAPGAPSEDLACAARAAAAMRSAAAVNAGAACTVGTASSGSAVCIDGPAPVHVMLGAGVTGVMDRRQEMVPVAEGPSSVHSNGSTCTSVPGAGCGAVRIEE